MIPHMIAAQRRKLKDFPDTPIVATDLNILEGMLELFEKYEVLYVSKDLFDFNIDFEDQSDVCLLHMILRLT